MTQHQAMPLLTLLLLQKPLLQLLLPLQPQVHQQMQAPPQMLLQPLLLHLLLLPLGRCLAALGPLQTKMMLLMLLMVAAWLHHQWRHCRWGPQGKLLQSLLLQQPSLQLQQVACPPAAQQLQTALLHLPLLPPPPHPLLALLLQLPQQVCQLKLCICY